MRPTPQNFPLLNILRTPLVNKKNIDFVISQLISFCEQFTPNLTEVCSPYTEENFSTNDKKITHSRIESEKKLVEALVNIRELHLYTLIFLYEYYAKEYYFGLDSLSSDEYIKRSTTVQKLNQLQGYATRILSLQSLGYLNPQCIEKIFPTIEESDDFKAENCFSNEEEKAYEEYVVKTQSARNTLNQINIINFLESQLQLEKLYKLNKEYLIELNKDLRKNKTSPSHALIKQKKEAMKIFQRHLNDAKEKAGLLGYNFHTYINELNQDSTANSHRDPTWQRYIINGFYFLTVVIALVRMTHSKIKYNTCKFWRPTSRKLISKQKYECNKLIEISSPKLDDNPSSITAEPKNSVNRP